MEYLGPLIDLEGPEAQEDLETQQSQEEYPPLILFPSLQQQT